ncbi:AI-2E family transporter [Lacrimispora sp. NSJ-141]|uniref:AI-2E family transporter n=1 Tax=Lientehia hominis TaxID=2897778 RepID=A0AAP2RFG3_9FIRM|nr:AI-2E family transporter [Lientehia hominis]MCD2491252.1 AI-2E family transporter [Lientehia hominis]
MKKEEEGKLETARHGMKKYASMGLTAFLVIAASILFFLLLYKIDVVLKAIRTILKILEPIVFGFVFAYIMYPVVRFFEKRLDGLIKKIIKKDERAVKLNKGVSIFLALLFWVAIIVILGVMVLPELYTNIRNMIVALPGQIQHASAAITDYMGQEGMNTEIVRNITEKIITFFNNWVQTDFLKDMNMVFGYLTAGVINFFSTTLNIVVGVIVALYVLNGRRTFKRQAKQVIYAVFSKKNAGILIDTLKDSNRIFGGFIAGKLVDSLIIGILCFIVLYFLNMPYTVLVSVIVGVTNVIPFFGPYMGAIPSAILILLANPAKGVIFIIFIIILQQIDGNIIGPKILGESTGLSAFWVVFSILLFGGLFGIVGMLIGVPVFAVIYQIISSIVDYKLRKKGMTVLADEGKIDKDI